MRIYIGNDHGGVELKNEVAHYLKTLEYDVINVGTDDSHAVDYPEYGHEVAKKVIEDQGSVGIVICGTGIGISIAANKVPGIRCALCNDVFSARATREHNDANVLALGARVTGPGLALMIVKEFLDTSFSEDQRHISRIEKIESI